MPRLWRYGCNVLARVRHYFYPLPVLVHRHQPIRSYPVKLSLLCRLLLQQHCIPHRWNFRNWSLLPVPRSPAFNHALFHYVCSLYFHHLSHKSVKDSSWNTRGKALVSNPSHTIYSHPNINLVGENGRPGCFTWFQLSTVCRSGTVYS